jgi:hypothetical protein
VRGDADDGVRLGIRTARTRRTAGRKPGLIVQKHTRVPEPPIEVPMAQVARVTLEDTGSSVGRSIGIGIAAGLGVFFGILAIIAAAD